jgi:hypothetical protein
MLACEAFDRAGINGPAEWLAPGDATAACKSGDGNYAHAKILLAGAAAAFCTTAVYADEFEFQAGPSGSIMFSSS